MFKKTREDDKPRIKLKVNRPSGTYRQGEIVEGKILVAGIKKKLNVLSVNVIGAYVPSSSKKAIEAVPGLAKISKSPIFEFEKILVNEYVVSGSIKKTFSFELDRKGDRPFFETYYGFLFAVKYVVHATVRLDENIQGTAKVEIQVRNYSKMPMEPIPMSIPFESPADAKGFGCQIDLDDTNINIQKGITGTITFKSLKVQCLAIYGCLIRKEEITVGSVPLSKVTPYQNIQLTYGEPNAESYRFFYSMPKNYSCETSQVKNKGMFSVGFLFGMRVLLKSGHILNNRVNITIYRLEPEQKLEEEMED